MAVEDDCAHRIIPAGNKRTKTAKASASSPAASPAAAEKRLARWKPKCPKNILERVQRVYAQRFFMVKRERVGTQLQEKFDVLGSTGNVYTVTICQLPNCSCPDGMKGNHCKHIIFIMLKVLGVPQNSELYYQKALLTAELAEIFSNAPPSPADYLSQRARQAYAEAKGEASTSTEPAKSNRKELEECAICYEDMNEAQPAEIVYCDTSCGKGLHKECFQQYARTQHGALTCVWCRQPWTGDAPPKGAGGTKRSAEGYLNLGDAMGINTERDSSSYYQGPRAGMTLSRSALLYDAHYYYE